MAQMATGRLRSTQLSDSDRNVAMWTHLSPLLGFFVLGPITVVIPVFIWLNKRESSAFVDDHGREVVNMSITGILLLMIAAMSGGILAPLWLVWAIVILIGVVRGANAAHAGEFFRYPMTVRFIS